MTTLRIAIVNGPDLFPIRKLRAGLEKHGIKLKPPEVLERHHIWRHKPRTKKHAAKSKFRLSRHAEALIHGFNEGEFDYLVVGHCKGLGRKVVKRVDPVFRGRVLIMHATPLPDEQLQRYLKLGIENFETDCRAHHWILEQEGATDAPTCA